jgi:hypothetical protein
MSQRRKRAKWDQSRPGVSLQPTKWQLKDWHACCDRSPFIPLSGFSDRGIPIVTLLNATRETFRDNDPVIHNYLQNP